MRERCLLFQQLGVLWNEGRWKTDGRVFTDALSGEEDVHVLDLHRLRVETQIAMSVLFWRVRQQTMHCGPGGVQPAT